MAGRLRLWPRVDDAEMEEFDLMKKVVVVSVRLWNGRLGERRTGKEQKIKDFCGERMVLMKRVKWTFTMRC